MGLGALHHLNSLLELKNDSLPPLIFWEPISEIANQIEFQKQFQSICNHLTERNVPFLILNSFDSKIWPDQIKSFLLSTKRASIETLIFPGHTRIVPKEIENFKDFLNSISKGNSNVNSQTKNYFRRIWTQNYLKNISQLESNRIRINLLTKLNFSQLTVVFVGASPTLESEIQKLKKYRDKLIIITSDTATQYVISEGILPDFILSIDSGRGTLYHFLPKIPDTIPIITWFGGSSYIFSLPNPLFIINTDFPMDQLITYNLKEHWPSLKNPSLNLGGMAKSLAKFAGAKKLILSGISFEDEKGKSHCKGTGYESYRLPFVNRKNTWEKLNHTNLYVGKKGKNKLAWDKLWENEKGLSIVSLNEVPSGLLESEKQIDHKSYYPSLSEAKGFPESTTLAMWERAFQEFPDAIADETFRKWFF